MGLTHRNPYVVDIVTAMRETNRALTFDDFVNVVCSYTGEVKTKDGLRRVFNLYDKEQTGVIEFEQLKAIAREIGEPMAEEQIM